MQKIEEKNKFLNQTEEESIKQKLNYELVTKHFRVLRNASIGTIIAGLLPLWALYQYVDTITLLSWYTVIFFVHVGCIIFTYYFQYRRPDVSQILPWSRMLHVATFISTLSYGMLGFILVPDDPQRQIFILSFLIIISSAIALGTSSDIVASVIGISCSLLPFIFWQFHQAFFHDTNLHIQTGGILTIYMIFLLTVSYIGYRLVKKSAELSFTNIALSEKLTDANIQLTKANDILEVKVQERTQELQTALQKVTYQTTHDIITGLPNQESLYEFIREEIARAEQNNYGFGIACFTINQTELLINTFGYRIWTLIIKTVAERLAKFCENQNNSGSVIYKVALTRRDVFAIIISPLKGEEEREKVRAIFSILTVAPIVIENQEIFLTASIGASLYPNDATAAEILLTCADATMYDSRRAKSSDDNLLFYKPTINAMGPRTIKLLSILSKAFYNNEFQLYYQPLLDLQTGRICGLEALSRWHQKELGSVSPDEFIPLVQNSKISLEYDKWVLHTACKQLKNWHKLGFKDLRISINFSEEFLKHQDLSKIIKEILIDENLQPEFLEVEFLETIAYAESLLPNFLELRNMGVNVAVDDYGKGQGDLEKIKSIPFTKIKIDKEFIQVLTLSERNQQIVKSAIDLAKRLGCKVVAEGVETYEQLNFLKKNECDMIQGFYFSKPMPADYITELLKSGKSLNDIS